ncbi:MAG: hypothetical protein ACR2FO_05445 [Actinomycetota bacterium]
MGQHGLSLYNPDTRRLVTVAKAEFLGGADPNSHEYWMAVGPRYAWVTRHFRSVTSDGDVFLDGELIRISLNNRSVIRMPLKCDPAGAPAVTKTAVWVACGSGEIRRLDPASGHVLARMTLQKLKASSIAADDSAVWVQTWTTERPGYPEPFVLRLDPKTMRVAKRIPVRTSYLAVGKDADFWGVAGDSSDRSVVLTRLSRDPSNRVEVPLGERVDPRDVVVGPNAVWVLNGDPDAIVRIAR